MHSSINMYTNDLMLLGYKPKESPKNAFRGSEVVVNNHHQEEEEVHSVGD